MTVVQKTKYGKAADRAWMVSEYFKALCMSDVGATLLTELIQLCWDKSEMQEAWKISKVVMIFKKGAPSVCDNYRPISLLAIGYKILAAILLNRLKLAGAETRILQTQYGFKSKCGSADALFVARRLLENA